jgi:protein-S-isoprenylcysteine O-methyltransferase Ste14
MRRPAAAIGSAIFFLVAPCVVAGLVPWLLTGWESEQPLPGWDVLRPVGALLILAGVAALVHSFVRFVIEGFGTPAPVAPASRLVVGGLYRYVRNPMYVAIAAVIVGQALLLGQLSLLIYALAVLAVFAAFVRFYEEPVLSERFGAEYEQYRAAVRGWLPRLRPWIGPRGEGQTATLSGAERADAGAGPANSGGAIRR